MSKTYRTVKKTSEYRELVETLCDWCGANVPEPGAYKDRRATLKFGHGSSYPEGGYLEGWQVEDLCDPCIEKLRVVLVREGINVTKLDIDW